jgi:hypothetical protein
MLRIVDPHHALLPLDRTPRASLTALIHCCSSTEPISLPIHSRAAQESHTHHPYPGGSLIILDILTISRILTFAAIMTRLKMLPPVVRHITVPPSPSFARPFIQSKGCELHPKKPLSDGRIPGAFHNLFVSRSRPSIHEDNLADEEADGKCLVKSGGLNFR